MNKKGQIWAIFLIVGGLIAIVLMVAAMTIGWGIVKFTADEILPEFNDLPSISDNIDLGETAEKVTGPIATVIDSLGLIMGLVYIIGVVGLLSLAFIMRDNHDGWVIALFVVSVLLLVISCIVISQFYEEFYVGQDEIGATLREASLPSNLIIYSPAIMTFIAFIAGIIFFTGKPEGAYIQ